MTTEAMSTDRSQPLITIEIDAEKYLDPIWTFLQPKQNQVKERLGHKTVDHLIFEDVNGTSILLIHGARDRPGHVLWEGKPRLPTVVVEALQERDPALQSLPRLFVLCCSMSSISPFKTRFGTLVEPLYSTAPPDVEVQPRRSAGDHRPGETCLVDVCCQHITRQEEYRAILYTTDPDLKAMIQSNDHSLLQAFLKVAEFVLSEVPVGNEVEGMPGTWVRVEVSPHMLCLRCRRRLSTVKVHPSTHDPLCKRCSEVVDQYLEKDPDFFNSRPTSVSSDPGNTKLKETARGESHAQKTDGQTAS